MSPLTSFILSHMYQIYKFNVQIGTIISTKLTIFESQSKKITKNECQMQGIEFFINSHSAQYILYHMYNYKTNPCQTW